MTALANLQGAVDAANALKVTVVAQTGVLSPVTAIANLQGKVDAAGALVVTGAAAAPMSGAGAPTSGAAGVLPGTLYLDTSQTPNVVYINVGTALVSSWMSLLSGNVV